VQGVDHRIATPAILTVAGRKKHDRVTIDGITFEVALEASAVNRDVLDGDGLRAGDHVRHVGLDLGERRQ
jgi:hypothetical protein